ncbi:MAG: PKD domain-containing protein [Candidatus Peribacteraceae bacterium]|nr:PKD domain-containing protein [Candidatus Peribacteraceae bacterium]MDD5074770.1 PKD domain-containing protein [Candidatus Peribacteraceae bacterium]
MIFSRLRHRLPLPVILAGLLFTTFFAGGASAASTSTTEDITLSVGSIFEILAALPGTDSSVSWTLLKEDGSFVQADRGRIFHERFVETGNFSLKAEVGNAASPAMLVRTFFIHVSSAALPLPSTPGIMTGTPIVRTDPPVEEGNNVVLGNQQTILLSPLSPGTARLSLDLDHTIDNNRDGNPSNDTDDEGTFFLTDGTPLRIWFPEFSTDRTITIMSMGAQGTTAQTLRVTTAAVTVPRPDSTPSLPNSGGTPLIAVDDRGNGVFGFSLKENALTASGRALLFLWDFGDGRQSMLDRPMHTFSKNNSYTVRLTVRDLKTAQNVLDTGGALQVTSVLSGETGSASSSGQSASSVSSSSAASSAQSSVAATGVPSGMWGTIGVILLVVIASLILGFMAMFIIARIVKRNLDTDKTPTTPQKSRTASGERKSSSLDHAPPMPVIDVSAMREEEAPVRRTPKAERAPAEEVPKVEEISSVEPPSTLQFDENQAPSWLKQAHEEATRSGHTFTTPPPPTLQEETPSSPPPPPPSTPPSGNTSMTATESIPPPAASSSDNDASIPPWLAQASAPHPSPEPVQEPTAPPPPPVIAAMTPAPEPVAPPQVVKPANPPEPAGAPPAQSSLPPSEPSPVSAITASPAVPTPSQTQSPVQEISPEERERRKKKRQRYKTNKRKREQEEKAAGSAAPSATDTAQKSAESEADDLEQEMIREEQAIAEPAVPKPPAPAAPAKSETHPGKSPVTPPAPTGEATDSTIAIIRADNISDDRKKSA